MTIPVKGAFTFDWAAQSDYPSWGSAQFKQNLNARDEELKSALNAIANMLNSTAVGVGGADNIGATAPTGLTGVTVQAILGELKTVIDAHLIDTAPHGATAKYYAKAYQNAAQTITAVGTEKVLFQVESYDSQSEFDVALSRYTAKVAGIISVNAAIQWDGAQTDANVTVIYIYKNGVRYSQIDFRRTGAGGVSQSAGNGNVQVAIGDYLEIFAYTAQQLATGPSDTWAEFCKIA